MPLDLDEVAEYLMERGLVKPKAIVEGEFRVEDMSRLNKVFVVKAGPGRGFALKLADPEDRSRVAREAAVLRRLDAADHGGALRERVPRLVDFDDARGVLILEAEPGAQDLKRCQPGGRYSLTLAREAARALAALHELPPTLTAGLDTSWDPAATLRVHDLDLARLQTLSVAGMEVVRLVQGIEGLASDLESLAAAEPEATIHGDVRWENCLGVANGTPRRTRLQLIDWEFARTGDPAGDVGAFLGEYLRAWLVTLSTVSAAALARSRVHLGRLHLAASAFWAAYAAARHLPTVQLGRLLRRAVLHAGARLILGAAEEAQARSESTPALEDAVRLGAHILRRPDESGVQLLGLLPTWATR